MYLSSIKFIIVQIHINQQYLFRTGIYIYISTKWQSTSKYRTTYCYSHLLFPTHSYFLPITCILTSLHFLHILISFPSPVGIISSLGIIFFFPSMNSFFSNAYKCILWFFFPQSLLLSVWIRLKSSFLLWCVLFIVLIWSLTPSLPYILQKSREAPSTLVFPMYSFSEK